MADNISEIISPEGERQLRELNEGLESAIQNITKFGQVAKGITVEFKGVKDFATLNELQNKVRETTEKMTKAQRDFADEIDRAQVREQAAVAKALAGYERQAAAAEKANAAREKAAQRAASEMEKAAERERKALGQLTNDYELLKKAYTDAANKAKELGVTFGTNSKVFKDAAANAKVMYDRLLKVEMAVGQGQRAVGQYNQAAFAMQQILREGPAFANSFATGIMAISNNLPILADEIKRLKSANEELRASGGKTIPVWKTLMEAIVSPMGLLSIAITGFTFLATKVDLFSFATDKAKESVDELTKSLNHYGEAAADNQQKQVKNAEVLVAIVGDETKSLKIRQQAFDELQKMFPQYLQNLKAEDMLKGKAYETLQKIKEEIEYRTQLQSLEEEGVALRKQEMELRIKANTAETLEDQYTYRKALEQVQEQIKRNTKDFNDYKLAVMTFPTAQKEEKEKKKTTKQVKDFTLKAENELTQAIFNNKQKEQEIIRDTNKSISEDTQKSVEERIAAYQRYMASVLAMAENERDRVVEVENEKIDEIDRLKKGKSGQELRNLIDMDFAARVRINTAQKEFNNKQKTTVQDSQKDILGIVNSNNEQWIKSEEFRNEKLKELQINLFLKDAELLNRALQNKEITQKEYNKRMAHLRKTEGAMLLQDDIDLYEKLLQNQTLSAEKQLEIQKKLNQARKAKSQMSQGRASKSGRLTDGLATSLGITDESEQQAFYDASINLANQAADAIISANRRQYEAEMAMLDRKREAIQTNYDLQMNLIDATSKTEEEYAERVAKLNSQRAEQEAAIEQQKKEAAIKQARFEKAAAIASIIQNTAVAIASALKLGPAAPFVVALIAAAGAAQLASVASAPIPAYKEGTDYHKGGAFIAGDGGAPELIAPPNKAPYWSASTSTLYNESAGTKVIPIDKYLKNVDATGGYRIGSVNSTAGDNPYKWIEAINNGFSETGEALALSWAQIARANRPNINMNALAEEMRRERNLQGK
jgi:hypothetical protein